MIGRPAFEWEETELEDLLGTAACNSVQRLAVTTKATTGRRRVREARWKHCLDIHCHRYWPIGRISRGSMTLVDWVDRCNHSIPGKAQH
jgi:hypothetical protein